MMNVTSLGDRRANSVAWVTNARAAPCPRASATVYTSSTHDIRPCARSFVIATGFPSRSSTPRRCSCQSRPSPRLYSSSWSSASSPTPGWSSDAHRRTSDSIWSSLSSVTREVSTTRSGGSVNDISTSRSTCHPAREKSSAISAASGMSSTTMCRYGSPAWCSSARATTSGALAGAVILIWFNDHTRGRAGVRKLQPGPIGLMSPARVASVQNSSPRTSSRSCARARTLSRGLFTRRRGGSSHRQGAHGVAAVPGGRGVPDVVEERLEAGRLDELPHRAAVGVGLEVAEPLGLGHASSLEDHPTPPVLQGAERSVVVGREAGDMVQPAAVRQAEVAVRGRLVVEGLNQLHLHGPGIAQRDRHARPRGLAAVPQVVHRRVGQVEERPDVELVDPVLHGSCDVVDDEPELRDRSAVGGVIHVGGLPPRARNPRAGPHYSGTATARAPEGHRCRTAQCRRPCT